MIIIAKKRAFVKNQYAFSAFFRKRYCEICAFSRQIARISCRDLFYDFIGIQYNGKWSIIAQRNLHICSENAMFHDRNGLLAVGNHVFIQSLCGFGCSGSDKAGAVALPAVCIQCKLAHHKDLAAHILKRAVRLSVLILKNAESADLVRHFICDRLIILIRYTEKDQESLSDGTGLPPVHMYRRMFYSL